MDKAIAWHDCLKRKEWFSELNYGDDKRGMLAVQSIRNPKMVTISTATLSALISMGPCCPHEQLLSSPGFLGSRSEKILVLKYGSAALFLVACSSMAIAYMIDTCFHVNELAEFCSVECSQSVVIEKGFLLAMLGNRILCMTLPAMMLMFGPVPVVVSSAALVWGLYELDLVKPKACP